MHYIETKSSIKKITWMMASQVIAEKKQKGKQIRKNCFLVSVEIQNSQSLLCLLCGHTWTLNTTLPQHWCWLVCQKDWVCTLCICCTLSHVPLNLSVSVTTINVKLKQARKLLATLVWNYDSPTDSLTGVKFRATSVAKNDKRYVVSNPCMWNDEL